MTAKEGDDVLFRSTTEIESKELDYVLVWDEELQGYRLEKLNSTILMQPTRGSGISPQQKAKTQQYVEDFKLEEDSAANDEEMDDFGDLDSLMEEVTSNASVPVREAKPRSLFGKGNLTDEEAYHSQ
jgi:RNA polymerase II transcription elongation factor